MFPIRGIVFDLDGTLVHSKHDYNEMRLRVKQLLLEAGVKPVILEESGSLWRVIRGDPDSLQGLGILDSMKENLLQEITKALNSVEIHSLETIEIIPNASETLEFLHNEGYKIGIATRACKEYSERALEKLGLTQYIQVMLARDEVIFPKPDPRHLFDVLELLSLNINEVIYVGDTSTDLDTAKAANVPFIAYLGNPRWAARLKEAGITYGITDLSDLKNLVKKKV